MIGIPLMLTVLANVGSLMAEGLEYSWTSNKERLSRLAGLVTSFTRSRRKLPQTDPEDNEQTAEGEDAEAGEEDEKADDDLSATGLLEMMLTQTHPWFMTISTGGLVSNILTFVGTVATLGIFFAGGALFFTFYEGYTYTAELLF